MNTSTPFSLDEYDYVWKHPQYMPWGFDEYKDFTVGPTPFHIMFRPDQIYSLVTTATRLALSLTSGSTPARLSQSRRTAAASLISISMVTWRLSACTRIGNVSYPSSLPCKIVSANGALRSWRSLRSSPAWLLTSSISTLFVSTRPRRSRSMPSRRGQPAPVLALPTWAKITSSFRVRSLVVIASVRSTCT